MWGQQPSDGLKGCGLESISRFVFFQGPIVPAIGMAMAMRRKKSAAKFPEPRPDLLLVGLRYLERFDFRAREKLKASFATRRRLRRQLLLHFKQKHQPMRLPLEAMLAHHAGQMQIRRGKLHADFLLRLAASARVRGFADVHLQLAATRAPKAAVRFLRPLQQKDVVLLVEAVEQRGNFVGQNHLGDFELNFSGLPQGRLNDVLMDPVTFLQQFFEQSGDFWQ